MTSPQLFYEFKLLINKAGTQSNATVSLPWFVTTYNREAERWLQQSLGKKGDSQEGEDLSDLLVVDAPLVKSGQTDLYSQFSIPEDWFQLEGIKAIGVAGCRKVLNVRPVKSRNIPELMADPLNNPSFEWEETIYTLSRETLYVYQQGFTIPEAYLTYYRKPRAIDIQGYTNLEKNPSATINPDLADLYCRQILDRVAKEYHRSIESSGGFQLSGDRLTTEERENF